MHAVALGLDHWAKNYLKSCGSRKYIIKYRSNISDCMFLFINTDCYVQDDQLRSSVEIWSAYDIHIIDLTGNVLTWLVCSRMPGSYRCHCTLLQILPAVCD